VFHFALEYVMRKNEENVDDVELDGTHQQLAYADGVTF
jgi:hypothetical protein